jgi:hypothetical protein
MRPVTAGHTARAHAGTAAEIASLVGLGTVCATVIGQLAVLARFPNLWILGHEWPLATGMIALGTVMAATAIATAAPLSAPGRAAAGLALTGAVTATLAAMGASIPADPRLGLVRTLHAALAATTGALGAFMSLTQSNAPSPAETHRIPLRSLWRQATLCALGAALTAHIVVAMKALAAASGPAWAALQMIPLAQLGAAWIGLAGTIALMPHHPTGDRRRGIRWLGPVAALWGLAAVAVLLIPPSGALPALGALSATGRETTAFLALCGTALLL